MPYFTSYFYAKNPSVAKINMEYKDSDGLKIELILFGDD